MIISPGLKNRLEILKHGDDATFDAWSSYWLEDIISCVQSTFSKGILRLIIQAKYIGFGEGHREKLHKDPKYRDQTLKCISELADIIEKGNNTEIFLKLGDLYALFFDKDQKTISSSQGLNSVQITSHALIRSAEFIEQGEFGAEDELSKALKIVAGMSESDSNRGISLLTLQWAIIRIKTKEKSRSAFSIKTLFFLDFPNQLRHVAKSFEIYDLRGAINVITESL